MDLFRMELYKILRRRFLWGSLGVLIVFAGLWFWNAMVGEKDTVADGVRYTGLEAIAKDREIAEEWQGTLTIGKLYDIIDTYGMAVNEGADWETPRTGNWVSRYATDMLTDFLRREDHSTADFLSEEELSRLADRLEQFRPGFTYMENLGFFLEMNETVNLVLVLIMILVLSSAFTEEYQYQTAALLLTCEKGKKELLRAKLAAAVGVAEGLYILVNFLLLAAFLFVYGTDGLGAGASLIDWVSVRRYQELAFWQVYLIGFLWGMLGVFGMTVAVLLFSAKSSRTFLAFAGSLVFFASGYFVPRVLSQILPFLILRLPCRIWGDCNPLGLLTAVSGGSVLPTPLRLALVAAGIIAGLYVMGKKWKRYEG